ncbi:MAG: hypothetical protein CVU91_02345 [Firmicutes bacterium HGW-Firmicutes-16]|nr:MAG: hypothetical protein CVU91_02345 [Firmicutes bacterium HGW-Firmicutes-16]
MRILSSIVLSKEFTFCILIFFIIVIVLESVFIGKIVPVVLKKILIKRYNVSKEIVLEAYDIYNVEKIYIKYYSCYIKSITYFGLSFALLLQLIFLFIFSDSNFIESSTCAFTLVIAYFEYRDSRSKSKYLHKDIRLITLKLGYFVFDLI